MNNPSILYSQKKEPVISNIKITHTFNNSLSQEQLNDKYILLEFWATWCAPCLATLPHINRLQDLYKSNNNLVFVSITDETEEKVNTILKRFNFSTNVISDTTKQTHNFFNINSLPKSFLIDNYGLIQWVGNPKDISKKMIDNLLSNKTIELQSNEYKTLKDLTIQNKAYYDSLALKYRGIYNDNTTPEYFSLDKNDLGYLGKTLNDISPNFYFSYGVGVKFDQIISKLLNISNIQLHIPDSFQKTHFSYCFKEDTSNSSKQSRMILFNNILKEMNLSVDSSFKDLDQYVLTVENEDLLDKAQNKTKNSTSKFSSSDLGEVYAIDNNYLNVLIAEIENRFKINISLEKINKSQITQRYNMTFMTNSMTELKSSLELYGLQIKKSKKQTEVYTLKTNKKN